MSAPSKAAIELAEDIEKYLGLENCTKPIRHMIAKRIDRFMGDILTQAQYRTERYLASIAAKAGGTLQVWRCPKAAADNERQESDVFNMCKIIARPDPQERSQ